ncbi:hypothetical protein [Eleftheria terrae]|uniref:hypothetical protein n=1 Tax=Eleftheria terrae TaxID=1597781 RepID=UPI00263A47E4|nr:hypothetical protein [Eleftheria terrae]WKB54002.1 hypothetical protein N7L95_06330 [Eleftheria terrae]
MTTLLTSVLRSQEWLHLPAPLDGPGRIALWYALIAFFVMSRAWVGQRRVHWHWPVIGILACGSVCASRAASLSIFLPLVVPAWLLALYLCVFHLRRGAGEGTQLGQEPAAV